MLNFEFEISVSFFSVLSHHMAHGKKYTIRHVTKTVINSKHAHI